MQRRYSESERATAQAAFAEAVKVVGSNAKVAKALDISKSAVAQWKGIVPSARAYDVARLSGVPVERLCPALLPPS